MLISTNYSGKDATPQQLQQGTIKRIHVNQHIIRRNAKEADIAKHEPPLTIKTSRRNYKGYRVIIEGPSSLVYEPEQPLPCGARVWIETTAAVVVV